MASHPLTRSQRIVLGVVVVSSMFAAGYAVAMVPREFGTKSWFLCCGVSVVGLVMAKMLRSRFDRGSASPVARKPTAMVEFVDYSFAFVLVLVVVGALYFSYLPDGRLPPAKPKLVVQKSPPAKPVRPAPFPTPPSQMIKEDERLARGYVSPARIPSAPFIPPLVPPPLPAKNGAVAEPNLSSASTAAQPVPASTPKHSVPLPDPLPPLVARPLFVEVEKLFELCATAVASQDVLDTPLNGRDQTPFRDVADAAALLVGLDVALSGDKESVIAVRPIFWTRDGSQIGRWHGDPQRDRSATQHRVEAKPGYAVGGLQVSTGAWMDSLQLVFYRVGDGRLDRRDRYESPRFGGRGGQPSGLIVGDGTPVIGLHGETADHGPSSLGLIKLNPKLTPPKPLTPAETPAFFARLAREIADGKTVDTELRGSGNIEYREVPSEGALLVGLEVALSERGDMIRAVRPIFRTATGLRDGAWHGDFQKGRRVRLAAKPDYAVGAITVHAGLGVDRLQLTFFRIASDGLNRSDRYESQAVGGTGGHSDGPLGDDGAPFVGVFGKTPRDSFDDFCGLGFVRIDNSLK